MLGLHQKVRSNEPRPDQTMDPTRPDWTRPDQIVEQTINLTTDDEFTS